MTDWVNNIRLDRIPPAARAGGLEGLRAAAELVLSRSDPTVPYRTGELRDSGRVTVNPVTLEAAISYDTPYAVRQHEDMTLAHDGGSAKYLENAMNQARPALGHLIAAHVRRRLHGR
jgi:Minor capsid protein